MADDPERSEKTEDPSAKKIADAIKRGDVAKSQEVTTWFMLLGTALVFGLMAPASTGAMVAELRLMMANADMIDTTGAGFGEFWRSMAQNAILITVVPMLALAACAILANLVQHRLVFSGEQLKPKLEKISPLAGFRRLFSLDALVNFSKGLLKLTIVGTVMFFVLWPERDRLDTMVTADIGALLGMFQELGLKLIGATLVVVTVIALADFLYQRHRWWERQKMTVREVREEFKQMEGDPTIKARIRQVRNERGRRRMMLAVPEADVVIANPTHYAVALKYDKSMPAPRCVAKGADTLALKIREIAEANGVPVVENPPLARALHASVELDETIPAEHFRAVAKVIGYVMQLRAKKTWRSAPAR